MPFARSGLGKKIPQIWFDKRAEKKKAFVGLELFGIKLVHIGWMIGQSKGERARTYNTVARQKARD